MPQPRRLSLRGEKRRGGKKIPSNLSGGVFSLVVVGGTRSLSLPFISSSLLVSPRWPTSSLEGELRRVHRPTRGRRTNERERERKRSKGGGGKTRQQLAKRERERGEKTSAASVAIAGQPLGLLFLSLSLLSRTGFDASLSPSLSLPPIKRHPAITKTTKKQPQTETTPPLPRPTSSSRSAAAASRPPSGAPASSTPTPRT